MQTIAVLITVFNRKDKTIKCLKQLYNQLLFSEFKLDVYLTNDGCTDGTPEAVNKEFPDVNIINGNGNLYWNRGMYIAWEEASKNDYDYYLWLNDDTILLPNALYNLLHYCQIKNNKSIFVASIRANDEERITYGGYCNNKLVIPNGELQPCTSFNGNCVLIPRFVYNKLGNLDWKFRHAIGDLEYGYRATKKGIKIYVSDKYLGICDKNQQLPAWTRKEIPLGKRIKNLYSPLGYAEPISFFYYERKNFGLFRAIKHFISIHIRVLFPGLWKQ